MHFTKIFLLLFFSLSVLFSCAQSTPVKVACIGNSITFGATHKDPSLTSYPVQLQALLGDRFEVRNFGVSGATLLKKGHRPYFRLPAFNSMLSFVPDIAIIHLGINDTDPRDWPDYRDDFKADYSWLIDTIRKVNPGVKIFICRLTPIFHEHSRFRSGTRDWYWQIQEEIAGIAQANNTQLIDFHTPLYSRPELLPDNVHPNEEGAALLSKTVYQQLTGNYGGLSLPVVFGSHMVLQRNKPICIYGTGNSMDKIIVHFNGMQRTSLADEYGKWKVSFPSLPAGGPYTITITSSSQTIRLEDVLVGEVWLCSGQSNMAFPLRAAVVSKEEMISAEKKNSLRLLQMKPFRETDNSAWDSIALDRANKLAYFSGQWNRCDSAAAKNFSAVAYFFADKLQKALHVPVGLIQVAVGGADAESWIDRYTMEHDSELVSELYNWRKSDFYQPWVRERTDLNLKNSDNPRQRHPYEPCYNYEAGISKIAGFPIAGTIWYQGESNTHNMEMHEKILPRLVSSWRKQWEYNFPFYYVQLSSLNRPSWPAFRNSQLHLLHVIPNSGMAVSSDAGDSTDVHPKRKQEVGDRLARLALHYTYGKTAIVPYGPMPSKAIRTGNRIIVSFQYAGTRLKTQDGKALRGFIIENEKGIKKEVRAMISGNKVVIPVDPGENPVTLLYGWKPYSDANLANTDNLPASTFRLTIE